MSRQQKKHSWNPYTSDVQRFSIYPRIQTPHEDSLRPGKILTVEIGDVDKHGNGIVDYKGAKIIVYNASLGSKVKIRITKVNDDVAYGEILEVLSEANEKYQ
ncbi:deoxyribonuclease/rho motif-related TRAM [Desulfurococcus amylolyticus 1221n]|uniref:Deoxyribonuclease/rho motif-related TRAM n=1 Tax=Desulfurococcus amylolyticus (strain DSM 18924 / JCM 16383 / VKM B-2413 / 1221n) TaxID=490899 RepID=B8D4U4_DESA1|nr:TRAM domain-containing protein [Desulfurococcus amylolyticus]ACL11125.1 deoxyribonuclease/rho motif-related TRAM [Desulfurococcus amylolyticus 1221n]